MTRFTVRVDDGGLPEQLLRLAVRFPEAIRSAYSTIGARWLNLVLDDVKRSPRTPPWERRPDGANLQARTGAYRRSLFFDTVGGTRSIAAIKLILGTRAKSGRIHELGGEIRAKRSRFLAIPLEGAFSGQDALPTSAFPDAFVLRTESGNLMLAQAAEDGGEGIEPLFLLRAKVKLRARTTLRQRARELARSTTATDALRMAFRSAVRGGAA